jgi:hypothetical protein
MSQVSSVSIVSDYRLDDRVIKVCSLAETKGLFLQPLCPDRLWGPPSLLSKGYWGVLSPGVKEQLGRDANHSPRSSSEVMNEYELLNLPPAPPWYVVGLLYLII